MPPLSPRNGTAACSLANTIHVLWGFFAGVFLTSLVAISLYSDGNRSETNHGYGLNLFLRRDNLNGIPGRADSLSSLSSKNTASQLGLKHDFPIPYIETSRTINNEFISKGFPSTMMLEGWGKVHVFFGDKNLLPEVSQINPAKFASSKWFSQVRQDEVVAGLFNSKKNGYFVDLAANDAVHISNTYALETQLSWSGLCIEPNPAYWESLSYRNCQVVGAVVGNRTMDKVMFKYPNRAGPRGGIVGLDFENKQPSRFGEDHSRYTVTLTELLDHFQAPRVIDYLSLDVEGAQYYVLENFAFDRYRFNAMTIERTTDKLKGLLEGHGYTMLKELKKGREALWVHRDVLPSLSLAVLDIDTQNYKYHNEPDEKEGRIA